MKRKEVLDLILYNSIPYELADSCDGWYQYRIPLADGEILYVEANVAEEYNDGEIPQTKVRLMWIGRPGE
jgi:hypothetical protein